jgi:hypothetical protein
VKGVIFKTCLVDFSKERQVPISMEALILTEAGFVTSDEMAKPLLERKKMFPKKALLKQKFYK